MALISTHPIAQLFEFDGTSSSATAQLSRNDLLYVEWDVKP